MFCTRGKEHKVDEIQKQYFEFTFCTITYPLYDESINIPLHVAKNDAMNNESKGTRKEESVF